jgi:hypothetical protein
MAGEASWLVTEEDVPSEQDFELLHNLDSPLWEQLVTKIESPVENLSIVSMYFDQSPAILDKLYESLKPKKIRIYTQNYTTTLTKDYLSHPLVKKGAVEILLCDYTDDGQHQNLHAKAIAVEMKDEVLLAYGSANCTTAALLRSAASGNVEVMLMIKGLSRRTLKPEKMFDPGQTAVRLREEMLLEPEVREIVPHPAQHEIRLFEADLDEKSIRLTFSLPDDLKYDQLFAALAPSGDNKIALPLIHLSEETYAAEVSEQLLQKLSESSSVVHIEAHDKGELSATSNGMFLIYLQDIKTGRSLRRERSLKEAQQSPAQFVEVFGSILEEGDDEATKNFLDSFNVRVTDLPVAVIYRGVGPVWERERAFMEIRGRPWSISESVHEAVLKFFERHHRRLLRHVENRSPDGVPNFMHILLTTGAVLHGQVEQGVIALKARAGLPLRPEEWSKQRDRLARYFSLHKDLLDCLAKQYLVPMARRYSASKIKEHLAPESEMLESLTASMMKLQQELETLRIEKLRVESTPGRLGVAPVFPASLFHPSQWPRYERDVSLFHEMVRNLLI